MFSFFLFFSPLLLSSYLFQFVILTFPLFYLLSFLPSFFLPHFFSFIPFIFPFCLPSIIHIHIFPFCLFFPFCLLPSASFPLSFFIHLAVVFFTFLLLSSFFVCFLSLSFICSVFSFIFFPLFLSFSFPLFCSFSFILSSLLHYTSILFLFTFSVLLFLLLISFSLSLHPSLSAFPLLSVIHLFRERERNLPLSLSFWSHGKLPVTNGFCLDPVCVLVSPLFIPESQQPCRATHISSTESGLF